MSDSDEKQRALDASMENEGNRDLTPMVQISIKEYDKLKERSKYITDRDMIGCIDKMMGCLNNILAQNEFYRREGPSLQMHILTGFRRG